MNLFADTSGWIALFNLRDKYHFRAREGIRTLETQEVEFVTTDYVLAEKISHLMNGVNHSAAIKFGNWVLSQPHVRILHLSESLWDEAWLFFQQYDDKEFAFTDCASFVVMSQLKLRDAFTFDHHFEQMGFRLWPQQA